MPALNQVPQHLVCRLWPEVSGFLESALRHGDGKYNADQLKMAIIRGEQSLIAALDDNKTIIGAVTVTFIDYPNARTAFVTAISGRMIAVDTLFDQLEEFCRINGATEIEGMARPSVARLWRQRFDFEQPAVIVRKAL